MELHYWESFFFFFCWCLFVCCCRSRICFRSNQRGCPHYSKAASGRLLLHCKGHRGQVESLPSLHDSKSTQWHGGDRGRFSSKSYLASHVSSHNHTSTATLSNTHCHSRSHILGYSHAETTFHSSSTAFIPFGVTGAYPGCLG